MKNSTSVTSPEKEEVVAVDLTEENLEKAIQEIQKYIRKTDEVISIKPTWVRIPIDNNSCN